MIIKIIKLIIFFTFIGFVLQCLEHYKYNATDVLSAILDENLPPDLAEIPFDTIRIPDEPEPEKPILAYRGKRNDYRDTMELLNDKSNIGDIKNFVLQNRYVYLLASVIQIFINRAQGYQTLPC